jgi:ABC-type Fe3+-hydroxamate transport system, periplasmic component
MKTSIIALLCIIIVVASVGTVAYYSIPHDTQPNVTSTPTANPTTNPTASPQESSSPTTGSTATPNTTPTGTANPTVTAGPTATPEPTTQVVTDMVGRTVTVPYKVTRIIGVNYGCLRLLTYMNASSLVCGVEQSETPADGRPYAMAHPEYQNLTKIGPQFGGDPELIAAAKPDVVFVTDYSKTSADSLQSQLGIPVISLNYGDISTSDGRQTLYQSFNVIGKVLHKDARAVSVENYIDGIINDLNTRTSNIADSTKPTVYIAGLSNRGAHGFTSTSAYYAPFTLTNSKNVVTIAMAQNSTQTVTIDIEALPSLNPQIIFVDYNGLTLIKQDVQAHPDIFNKLSAVTSGKTYGVLGYNYYTTNFDVALADAYYVGSVLYPTHFSDINPSQKADEIYTFLCGAPVQNQMVALYGPYGQVNITS